MGGREHYKMCKRGRMVQKVENHCLKERYCPNSWEIWHGNSVIGLIATGLDIDEDNQRIFITDCGNNEFK